MRIGIVAFGDYCDMDSATKFGDAYQCLPPTSDGRKIIDFINSARDTSGGDYKEFYELVIKKITEESGGKTLLNLYFLLLMLNLMKLAITMEA